MKLKEMQEKRNGIVEDMKKMKSDADVENRAVDAEKWDELNSQVKELDAQIKIETENRALTLTEVTADATPVVEERAVIEERAFEDFLRGKLTEERADVNMTVGDNGAVIPTTIANKIIKKITEISPIFSRATRYNVKGNLSIPYYDEDTNSITVSYADEFTDPESSVGKMASISLTEFLGRALVKVSKSLQNNSQFNMVEFVITDMAVQYAEWIDGELINGTTSKVEGLSGATNTVTAASATAVKPDELIDLQEAVKDAYQANAIWVMNKATRTAIRKLKDGNGQYILNKDANAMWGYTLFGKDVYTSAKCPTMATGNRAIFYGDMSGLAVKVSEEMNIQVLTEKYAEQHAIGVLGFIGMDSKVENQQKLAVLKMA